MKTTFLTILLAFLSTNWIFAQSADDFANVRLNFIYMDEIEILGLGDEGVGATVEFALITYEKNDIFQTIGLEVGYIQSELEESAADMDSELSVQFDTEVVPVLFNYTFSGPISESGFIWEAGIGVGFYFVEVDAEVNIFDEDLGDFSDSGSDDDVIVGGQVFGSLGYKFDDSLSLLVGIRSLFAQDADLFGVEDKVINSTAFDLSLNFSF